MWTVLTGRYAGKTTSSMLGLSNAIFTKTLHNNEEMCDHISDLDTAFTKLENAGQKLSEILQVSVLLESLKYCEEYDSTVAPSEQWMRRKQAERRLQTFL